MRLIKIYILLVPRSGCVDFYVGKEVQNARNEAQCFIKSVITV